MAWVTVDEMVCAALDRGPPGWTSVDLMRRCVEECAYLWVAIIDRAICGCVVAQIEDYPTIKLLSVLALAGQAMSDWIKQMHAALADWGRDCGCAYAVLQGREGWGRVLPADRVGVVHVVRL